MLRAATLFVLLAGLLQNCAHGGIVLGINSNLTDGRRWDAALFIDGNSNERSLVGGLRYSLQGQSYQAYRDLFQWSTLPTVAEFQAAIDQAFAAWQSADPTTGLSSGVQFVADLGTAPVGTGLFGGVNTNGAEIDLFGFDAGNAATGGVASISFINTPGTTVTLTSGTANYASSRIVGADLVMNRNIGAVYDLDSFRRLLTHEIGHTLGLGDLEDANSSAIFLDDNFNGTSQLNAFNTLTNSWASLVDPLNPAASSQLELYIVPNSAVGLDTPGVDLLMESGGGGIGANNPVTNLVPLTNDDYGTRQFLYPTITPVPEPSGMALAVLCGLGWFVRRRVRAA